MNQLHQLRRGCQKKAGQTLVFFAIMLLALMLVVGLCVDAGHLVYGGADPVEVIRTCGARVRYIHI